MFSFSFQVTFEEEDEAASPLNGECKSLCSGVMVYICGGDSSALSVVTVMR